MEALRPKDRRTLEIMAAIYGASGMSHRLTGATIDNVIASAVACAILTMNEVQKAATLKIEKEK